MVLSGTTFGFTFNSAVHACGGGATDNIQSLLERTQYVVKADVAVVDAVRQNAILSVDAYLFGGSGPEYLVFVQTDPVIVTRLTEGDPYGACNFFQPDLRPGLSAYFFLTRLLTSRRTTRWLLSRMLSLCGLMEKNLIFHQYSTVEALI